eukprot:g2131.t1
MQFASAQLPDLTKPPTTPRALKAINPNSVRAHSSAKRAARAKQSPAEKARPRSHRKAERGAENTSPRLSVWTDENTPMKKSLAHRLREEFSEFSEKGNGSNKDRSMAINESPSKGSRAESPSSASSPSPRKIMDTVNGALDREVLGSPLGGKRRAKSAGSQRGGVLPSLGFGLTSNAANSATPMPLKGFSSFSKYYSPSDQLLSPASSALQNGSVPGIKARRTKPIQHRRGSEDPSLGDTLQRGLSKLSVESTNQFSKK